MVSHCGLRFFYVYTKYFGGRYCIVVLSIDNIQFLITCTHSHISTNKMHVIRHDDSYSTVAAVPVIMSHL